MEDSKIFSGIINFEKKFVEHKFKIWLYQVDCLSFMEELLKIYPNGIFDMIFADPPYFLSNGGITCYAGKVALVDKGLWDKSKGVEENHQFNLKWLSYCQRLLKPNGTIWITGTHHVIYSVGFAMEELKMKILNNVSWEKPNPPPNISCRYFTHSTETIIWAAKNSKSKHFFNYELMRNLNRGKQMKTVWTIPAPSKEEKIYGKHPTQKPERLLERIILASTRRNDFIFDPFFGSCTTGVVALKLNRKFTGCEIDGAYFDLAIKRISNTIKDLQSEMQIIGETR